MPSCTVPMFSNRPDISHMIQCDMPLSRSASADDDGDRADRRPAWPSHSHSDSAAVTDDQQQRVQRCD